MAAEGRATGVALERRFKSELADQPYIFEFFQAVRLVERLSPGRVPVGGFAQPKTECVRFGVNNSLCFPASEIQAFHWRESGAPLMIVNFMGLTGPQGVLPAYYTQLVAERARLRDTAVRDFLDIFNHRMISLFYRAWEKYRFVVDYERTGRDQMSRHLFELIGLGTRKLQGRQPVPDYALAYYTGLTSQRVRSAVGMRDMLRDYFDVPVEIIQFAGAWYKLDRATTSCLDRGETTDSERLAFGAVVGDEVWNEQARVRIRLGPLTLAQYMDFLPSGSAYQPLRALARFFAREEMDFEAQLVLKREEVPGCELGREDETAARLGWISWAKSRTMERDPEETILQL
jgi:type VI secretion system protein ImpH